MADCCANTYHSVRCLSKPRFFQPGCESWTWLKRHRGEPVAEHKSLMHCTCFTSDYREGFSSRFASFPSLLAAPTLPHCNKYAFNKILMISIRCICLPYRPSLRALPRKARKRQKATALMKNISPRMLESQQAKK